jgi:hypothetical protein
VIEIDSGGNEDSQIVVLMTIPLLSVGMHIFFSKNLMIHQNSMIHQKILNNFLARRNLSKCKKPFSETVHILHVGSKYDLVL